MTNTFSGYETLQEIDSGAYGSVFLVRKEGAFFALKQVCRRSDADEASYRRELRGVQTLLRLPPQEGLAKVHECRVAEDGHSFFYTMDLADDELGDPPDSGHYRPRSLASVISAEVALPLRECLDMAIRLATVLVHLQRHHIVHRDIKPGNILFIRGKVVLADIGLLADDREAASIVGTPGYAPPERQGSPMGDVYGLGKTLYRISTGRPPEEAGLPPCTEADIDSPYFWKWMVILSKATAREPTRRYRSARGMLRDLRSLRRHVRAGRHSLLWKVALLALALGIGLPALWNLSVFQGWLHMGAEARYHSKPPFPYSGLKCFFAPKEDPCLLGTPWHPIRYGD